MSGLQAMIADLREAVRCERACDRAARNIHRIRKPSPFGMVGGYGVTLELTEGPTYGLVTRLGDPNPNRLPDPCKACGASLSATGEPPPECQARA
jgi:hypothetical protein